MKKEPRKHHIVPKSYIQLFTMPGSDNVAILDKHTLDIREQRPSEVLHIRDYYRQKHAPLGKDQFALEKAFAQHVESKLVGTIRKIEQANEALSEEELIDFINFLQIQRLRVPKVLDVLMRQTRAMITEVARTDKEIAACLDAKEVELVVKEEQRFNILGESLKSNELFRLFARMIWTVWRMPDNSTLVSSDCPVVIFNPDIPGEEMSGPGRVGAHVLFPLSPRFLLELTHPELEEDPSVDPLQAVPIPACRDGHVHFRSARLPETFAAVVNGIIALQADCHIFACCREDLEKLRPNHGSQPTLDPGRATGGK